MSSNSTIKFYKNNNIELSGNFIELSSNFVERNTNKIFLVLKKDNKNYISITRKNIDNNISKKNKKIFFSKSNTNNNIVSGFNSYSSTTPINLPQNNYLFNSNEISNNSTAILNYKLYELTKGNTSIPQLNLGDISNGLLKNLKNFNTIDDIQYKKNSYFSLDKFIGSDNSNIIQNVTYYRPTSISFDLYSFHNQLKDIYEFNFNENLTFPPDISSSLINCIAYSPEFNIYVILINYQISAEESSASYCIIDTSNIYTINHESLFINPLPYNISFGNSIIWSSEFSKFIIKGTSHLSENRLDRITIASSTYIDISNYVIHWNIDNELLEDNLTMDVIHYGSGESWNQLYIDNCNNYLIMTGEIWNNGGWYNIGNITKESVIFNNVQGYRVEGFHYISNMIFISSINKYFILGIDDTRIQNQQSNNPTHYNNAKWAYGSLDYNHTFTPDSSGILHNIINRAYDCIYIEKYNRIYGLGEYRDFTTPDKGVLLQWNVNSSDISFDMSYIFPHTNSQFRLNQISDNLIVTCGKTIIENTNKFKGSYNKIYLEINGDICNNLIISGHLPVDQESIFLNFAYNNDINQSSIIFAGGSSTIQGGIASVYNIEISNTLLSTDICNQSLYLSYAFKQKNNNTDESFYLIENPRDFILQSNPIDRNLYQLTTDRFSIDYDFLTPEYEIFSEKLKLIPTNYNGIIPFTEKNIDLYLKNNKYILHYNNKIIPMQNIHLTYDGDTDELIVKSLNRFFIGEVSGKFKLKFFDEFSEYEFQSTDLDVKFNIICNPNLCPLPSLPDRRQMSYRIGSMGSFRMQFSNNIQNAHKRTAGRRTVFIDQTKQLRVNNNNQNNNKQIVLSDYFYNLNNLKNWNYESIRLILNLKDYNYQIINNQISSERKNIPNPFLGMNDVINSMNALFKDADISINPDISHWNVSSITNMVDMFKNSKSITGEFIKTWDVSNVEEMGGMFYNARSFIADLSYWNVEKVNTMNNMFEGTPYFTGEGLQYWDISQTTTMFSIFENSAFNTDISNWNITRTFSLINSHNYEDIHDMFAGCNHLSESNRNSIITGWTNTLQDNGFTLDIINAALYAVGLSIT
uniref:Surface protein n=1 Tax=Nucleocytoviricota sp. TaxID=2809609 RepID=A0A9E8G4E1_9VIRU|nr:surface protein [Nucleocytoviricota sp.]UZT29163.1 surface protein [Nucleocytoviricota sp.]